MTENTKPTLREETELAFVEYGFQFQQAEFLSRIASNPLFAAIQREQDRQIAKWGVQDHPSFDANAIKEERVTLCNTLKGMVDASARRGTLVWEEIMSEEVAEAFCEMDNDENLKAELIQIAAVALSWIESINRKKAQEDEQV